MSITGIPQKSFNCAHDRAHVVAIAILQIIETCPHDPVRAVAAYLRDEFTDLERQAIDQNRPNSET
jgi:hypothetical protein